MSDTTNDMSTDTQSQAPIEAVALPELPHGWLAIEALDMDALTQSSPHKGKIPLSHLIGQKRPRQPTPA